MLIGMLDFCYLHDAYVVQTASEDQLLQHVNSRFRNVNCTMKELIAAREILLQRKARFQDKSFLHSARQVEHGVQGSMWQPQLAQQMSKATTVEGVLAGELGDGGQHPRPQISLTPGNHEGPHNWGVPQDHEPRPNSAYDVDRAEESMWTIHPREVQE